MSRIRTRNYTDGPLLLGVEKWANGSSQNHFTPHSKRLIEEISDEVHAGPPYKTGGPMFLRRTSLLCSVQGAELKMPGSGSTGSYSGDLRATGLSFNSNLPTIPSFSALEAEAWNRYRPGQPVIDLGMFLAELREFPALLRQTSLAFLKRYLFFRRAGGRHNLNEKEAAQAYLAYEFGWRPFVNDVKKLINVQRRLERAIAQLRRDNNRPIRRGGFVSSTSSTNGGNEANTGVVFHPQVFSHGFYVSGSGRLQTVTSNRMRSWFSARFRYDLPVVEGAGFRAKAMIELLGLNIVSPGVLWDLMPWSWLVDWFTNVGDVLENMSAQAAINLRADYAYLMVHSSNLTQANVKGTYWAKDELMGGISPRTFFGESNTVSEYKIRNSASPFGFGLDDTDLSVRQLAILSALGLSKT